MQRAAGVSRAPLLAVFLALAAASPVQRPALRVMILNPERDAILTGNRVPVVLKAEGIPIAPVFEHRPGAAHFHVFFDRDVTPLDSAIPFRSGIVHLSRGQSWYTFEGVAAGQHRIIAVLADEDHIPIKPLVSDTVRFTLKVK